MTTAAYLRVSTDLQSVESQRFELKMLFAANGWDYGAATEYIDEGLSGATDERPAFQRLRSDIASGGVTHVVCYDIDRLSRDVDTRSAFVRLCTDRAVRITDLNGELDASSPTGLLLERIRSAIGEFQRKQTGLRTSAGIRAKIAGGERWGGARVIAKRPGVRKFTDAEERHLARLKGTSEEVALRHDCSSALVRKFRKKWSDAVEPEGTTATEPLDAPAAGAGLPAAIEAAVGPAVEAVGSV